MSVSKDLELTIDGTTYDLRLARRDGRPMYDSYPAEAQTSDPTVPLFQQTDWSGGWGEGNYSNPRKYADCYSLDTTMQGKLILGPAYKQAGWTKKFVAGAYAKDDSLYTNETTACRNRNEDDLTLLPAAPVANQDAYFFGSSSKFSKIEIYISTLGVGTWTITWKYWNGSAWTALSDVDDRTYGFTAVAPAGCQSVYFTEPEDWATTTDGGNLADLYWVKADLTSFTSMTTQPLGSCAYLTYDQDGPIPDEITRFISYNDDIYMACGEDLYYTETTWSFQQLYDFGATITDLCVFDGKLFVALGGSTAYQYSSDGITFTASTLDDPYANLFVSAPSPTGAEWNLWKAVTPNEVKASDNPVNGGTQWTTSAYKIGDASSDITRLMLLNENLLVGKEDGLYHLDPEGRVHSLLPELQHVKSSVNFKHVTNYKGSLIFSLKKHVAELSSYLTYGLIDPYMDLLDMDVRPECVGVASDYDWLYVAMNDGTNYRIFKGKKTESGWEWCPLVNLGTSAISNIYVSYYLGTTTLFHDYYESSTYYNGYVFLSDNPIADSTAGWNAIYSFTTTTSGYLITGWYDAGHRDWTKTFQSVLIEVKMNSGDMDANKKVTLYYEIDESGSWVSIDTAYTTATAAGTKKYFDLSNVSCKKIRFKIQLDTDSTTKTPIVKFFAAYGFVMPTKVQVFDFMVDCSRPGGTGLNQTLRDFLWGGRDTTSLITLKDPFQIGTTSSHYVRYLPGYPRESFITQEQGKQALPVVHVKAYKVDWS